MGEKVSIRMARRSDAGAILEIYAPYVLHTAITFDYEVPELSEYEEKIAHVLERYPFLVAEGDIEEEEKEEGKEKQEGEEKESKEEKKVEADEEESKEEKKAETKEKEERKETKKTILGYAYAGTFKDRAAYDWACEMSIYVRRDLHRRGVGRALYEAMEEYLGKMGMINLYACIGIPEVEDEYLTFDSVHFHERMGYEMIGVFHRCGYKFGRWYHMCWMEKCIAEHGAAGKINTIQEVLEGEE